MYTSIKRINRKSITARKNTLSILIVSFFLIAIISALGLFQVINHFFYDIFSNHFSKAPPSAVVTVVVDAKSWESESDITSMIIKINKFSPKEILIFKEHPDQFIDIEKLSSNIKIVAIANKRATSSQLIGLELTEEFNQISNIGAAIPPALDAGIIRMSSLEFTTQKGANVKSFLHHYTTKNFSSNYFPINFDKVTPFRIEVTSAQILRNKAIKQLFNNKIVIVGPRTFSKQGMLTIPPRHTGIGLLQFHAISLEAVLNGAELGSFSMLSKLTLIVLFLILIFFVMQKLAVYSSLFVMNFIIIGGVIVLTIVSHAIETILPIGEFIISSILSYWIYFNTLQNQMVVETSKLSATIKNELRSTTQTQNFNETEKPWLEVTSLVQQYLPLNKTIFLEKVPKKHRVKEIQALNCSLSDIKEMSRDYEREPYSSAIRQNTLIEMNRPYFDNKVDGELEFIVPLLFAEKVLGFWVMTVKPCIDWDRSLFIQNVDRFTEQISYLLYNRQVFQKKNYNPTFLQRCSNLLAPKGRDNGLKYHVYSSLKKLSSYQNIFNTMHSSAIIYDLFGQVIEANDKMELIAERYNLNIFNLNTLDLLHKITHKDRDEIRKKLSNIILNLQASNFITSSELDNHTYMVSVTPVIENRNNSDELLDVNAPFSVIGLLVEFVDVASMQEVMAVERKINSLYLNDVYNALSSIQLCQMKLEELNHNPEVKQVLLTMQQQLSNVVKSTNDTHQIFNNMAMPNVKGILPVDLFNIYIALKKSLRTDLSAKNINIYFNAPKITSMVYANQYELISMLSLILTILIEDAQLYSIIKITGKQKLVAGKKIYYISINNNGFGIHKETLINLNRLNNKKDITGDVMKLRQVIDSKNHWHTKPRVFSKLGKGIRFSLTLSGV